MYRGPLHPISVPPRKGPPPFMLTSAYSNLIYITSHHIALFLTIKQANGRTLQGYVEQFRWDSAKFNTALSADALRQDINKKLSEIDTEMKSKSSAYAKVKQTLQQLEKRGTGSLLVRDVSRNVSREHFVLDSEYLVTLLVVVRVAMLFHVVWRVRACACVCVRVCACLCACAKS